MAALNIDAQTLAQCPSLKKPLIWIVYQGAEGLRCANLLETWAQRYDVELRLTKNHKPGMNVSILQRLQQDCDECEAAMVLITPDDRLADETGNALFELGFWFGKRGPELLQILKHKAVALPADFSSSTVREFASDDQLETAFASQAGILVGQLNPRAERKSGRHKVRAIFGDQDESCWLRPESYACHKVSENEQPCPCREASLEFVAELMRMGRANHERHTIEDALCRLAFLGKELLALPKPNPNRPNERARVIREFIDEGNALRRGRQDVFNTPGRSSYPPPQFNSEQRFQRFLQEKLACAQLLVAQPPPMPFDLTEIKILELNIDEAWRWLGKFQDVRFVDTLRRGEWGKGFRADMASNIQYFYDFALVLQAMNLQYFTVCRDALKACTQSTRNPRNVHVDFLAAIQKLPHNDANPWLRIWR